MRFASPHAPLIRRTAPTSLTSLNPTSLRFASLTRYASLYASQVNILAYDYDGYGLSEGEPSEQGVYADIEAAFNYLTDVLSVPPERVILYGRSLGSGPSCHLAMKQSKENRPVRGVILQSPVMSAYRVAFHFRFSMPGDVFCNIDKVPHINSPIFIMHGRRDEVVPFWHGQELFLATKPQYQADPFWVESAGHNNIELLLRDTHLFFDKLKAFINFVRENPDGRPELAGGRGKTKKSRDEAESSFACCAGGRMPGGDDSYEALDDDGEDGGGESKRAAGEGKDSVLGAAAAAGGKDQNMRIEALPQWR